VEQLIAISELPVEENGSEQAEYGERWRKEARHDASGNQQTAAEFKSNDGGEQNARHAEFLHVGCGLTIVADDAPALMHKNEGQQQSAGEQACRAKSALL
jgi:hypothetical protein